MVADARIEAHALDDLLGVQAVGGGIGVELVEIGHAHGEIGVGEQLDRLGLGGVGEQHRDVLPDGPLPQQLGEDLGALRALADDDARWVQVVVQGLALAQELRGEDQVRAVELRLELGGVAYRHGGLEDHHRFGVDRLHVPDHRLHRAGVEVVGLRVVIGGRGDDHVIGARVGVLLVQGGAQIERLVLEVVLDLGIDDGRLLAIEHRHLLGDDVEGHHFIVLCQQDGIGQADVAGTGNGDLHCWLPPEWATISRAMDSKAASGSGACVMGRPMTR